MNIGIFLPGFAVGFLIAAPVGPIGVLCIRRTVAGGLVAGISAGFGAATADAVYGSVAAFGLTSVSTALVNQQSWFRLVGAVFLCSLGIKTVLAVPLGRPKFPKDRGIVGAYISTFALTLANPMTILSFAAIFSGLGIVGVAENYAGAALLVCGVFMGSALWWLLLSSGVGIVHLRLSHHRIQLINKVSGVILTAYGVLLLISIGK